MKKRYTNSMLLVLLVMSAMLATGCPQPKSTTITANCTYNSATGAWVCPIGIQIVYDRPTQQVEDATQLIVDVPNGWTSNFSNANLNFKSNYQTTSEQNFAIPLSLTTSEVAPIATGSSVYTLVGDSASVQAAKASQSSANEAMFSDEYTVTQTSCDLQSGEYTFHFRSKDSGGVAYIAAATLVYQEGPGGGCVGSTAELKY